MSRASNSQNQGSRVKSLLMGLAAVVFALLAIGLFEGVLRLVGIGAPYASHDSPLAYQQIHSPMLIQDERPDGSLALRTNDPRLPFQELSHPKPEETLRIIVFGGSATAGLGYSPNAAFPRHLERMLEQSHPGRSVEVLNLGIVAFSSAQVAVLVEEAVDRYDPDALVLYSGNNEFLEIHAEKNAAANANVISIFRNKLANTNLFRAFHGLLRGRPSPLALKDLRLSQEERRQMQDRIMKQIQLNPDEIDFVVDEYQRNLHRISDASIRTNTPLLLMTVASNWEWLDRNGLSEGWLEEILPNEDTNSKEGLLLARDEIDSKLVEVDDSDRPAWFFKRAVLNRRLGEWESARNDYREAMNRDPRLRRALDSMADRVRRVAKDRGHVLVDTIERLSETAPNGVIGWNEFYDHVHFRPSGSLRVAGILFDGLRDAGIIQPDDRFESAGYVDEELRRAEYGREESAHLEQWMGLGPERGPLEDRDLWKYDRMIEDLDRRIGEDPKDARALVDRGNAYYFEMNGAEKALEHYEAALKAGGDDTAVRANLEKLRAEARP